MGLGNFTIGFAVGFGSGMAFRALAERDYEPAKQIVRTTVGMAQKMGDVALDTFGRLRESVEDMASHLRAERARIVQQSGSRGVRGARSVRESQAERGEREERSERAEKRERPRKAPVARSRPRASAAARNRVLNA